jgi:NitT/TauT family transport system ATP-binding protein
MIKLESVHKRYQSKTTSRAILSDISLDIDDGEFVSVVGPSGCGKSTLLNLIAGFVAPSDGNIWVAGQLVRWGQIPSRLGYLFQKDTVLPWLTVEQNVGLGLRYAHMPAPQIREKVAGLLKLANLRGYEKFFPFQLSGGMRQRTALLMTLACDPRVLLLDEPFGALDAHTKINLHRELHAIWREQRQTILMVTHDIEEAVALSDRVIVLSASPSQILSDRRIDIPHPRDPYTIRSTVEFDVHRRALWSVLGREFLRAPDLQELNFAGTTKVR